MMGVVHEAAIDGVRTFWVDSGRPTLAATLMFRVGLADETLATSGWLHLLEHLALHGLPRGTLAVNGSVGPMLTTFSMHGPPDQVAAALAEVTRRLADPDLSELDRERRVLAAEAATRGGPVQRAFGMRYGGRGPGLVSYDDLGLGRATPQRLVDLSRRAFPAANASLALDGPPPEAMDLRLGDGSPWAVTPATPVEQPRAVYPDGAGLVLSGVVSRSLPGTLVAPVLEDALRKRLRDQEGAAYSPYSVYEAVDADHALVVAGSDVSPTTAPSLLGHVVDLVGGLAADGPDPESLADVLAAMRQGFTDPYSVGYLSHRAAAQSLRGGPVEQLDDILDELDTVDGAHVATALAEFGESLVVGAPPGTSPHPRLRVIEQPESGDSVRGTRSVNWPAESVRLAVRDDAVTLGDARGHLRYPLREVAGYLVWDSGARGIVLSDGWSLVVRPDGWTGGGKLVERLDALVGPELHLPQPKETGPDPVARDPFLRRWWQGLIRWFGGPVASVIVVLVVLWCLYGLGQGVLAGEFVLAGVFPLIALAVVWFFHVPRKT
jgi:hypothetical protein